MTRRSSSEWKEMAASRPVGRSSSHASGSASSSWSSSALTAIRIAWNVRFAGMPAAEPRGRGDRGGDGVDELERRGERPALAAAHDLAGDPLGVALLAVLAQRARELAALPRVDDLGRGQVLLRVHAHVERRVVGVGEPARASVDLHRGHPEVEVDEVGLEALLAQQLEAVREVGADEARAALDLGGELGERLLGQRVAVDAHQQPGRPEALGDQAAVAARADRAVDRDLARLRVQSLDQLPGEDGDVRAWHVKQDGQERK